MERKSRNRGKKKAETIKREYGVKNSYRNKSLMNGNGQSLIKTCACKSVLFSIGDANLSLTVY